MSNRILFYPKAIRDLEKIRKADLVEIREVLELFASMPTLRPTWRVNSLRRGDHFILHQNTKDGMEVVRILHYTEASRLFDLDGLGEVVERSHSFH